jgi:hypothetical protein
MRRSFDRTARQYALERFSHRYTLAEDCEEQLSLDGKLPKLLRLGVHLCEKCSRIIFLASEAIASRNSYMPLKVRRNDRL